MNQHLKEEKRQASHLCCFVAETWAAVASSYYPSHHITTNSAIRHCDISDLTCVNYCNDAVTSGAVLLHNFIKYDL